MRTALRTLFRTVTGLRISMNPTGTMTNPCDPGSRMAFRGLVRLFALTLYSDYKPDQGAYGDKDCLKYDPKEPVNEMPVMGSLSDTLEDLRIYILAPSPDLNERAKANLIEIKVAGKFLPRESSDDFERSWKALK